MQYRSAIRAAARASFPPDDRHDVIGFRLVVELR
jgi:formylglycine-generating enzyme required for sulfatase activity